MNSDPWAANAWTAARARPSRRETTARLGRLGGLAYVVAAVKASDNHQGSLPVNEAYDPAPTPVLPMLRCAGAHACPPFWAGASYAFRRRDALR